MKAQFLAESVILYFLLQKFYLLNYDFMLRLKIFFVFFVALFSQLGSEELNLKISLKNGTSGGIGRADTIKLIALEGGMTPIGEFKDKQGDFVLEKVNAPEGAPVLIQVNYKGANYNKMVPPAPMFRTKVQEITVYEVTPEFKNMDVKSLMQILREENTVRVYKIFLIENQTNPPMSFYNKQSLLEVYVPKDATEVFGQLKQGDSKMAIPLTLTDGAKGKLIDRPILPGASELQISYALPAKSLADVSFKDENSFEDKKSPRVIFFKPKDMKLDFKGAISKEEIKDNIPQGLGAVRVKYPDTTSIDISVVGGSFEPEEDTHAAETRKVRNGTLFTTWDKSLLGVIGFLGLLFTLSFVFIYRK